MPFSCCRPKAKDAPARKPPGSTAGVRRGGDVVAPAADAEQADGDGDDVDVGGGGGGVTGGGGGGTGDGAAPPDRAHTTLATPPKGRRRSAEENAKLRADHAAALQAGRRAARARLLQQQTNDFDLELAAEVRENPVGQEAENAAAAAHRWIDAHPNAPWSVVRTTTAYSSAIGECLPWLIDALKNSHLDRAIKERARALLRNPQLTTHLDLRNGHQTSGTVRGVGAVGGMFGELRAALRSHLDEIGAPLKALYDENRLAVVLCDARTKDGNLQYNKLFAPGAGNEVAATALHPWLAGALDYTDLASMPEHVGTHIVAMLTVAINGRFERSCAELVATVGGRGLDLATSSLALPGPKAFTRMLNKAMSSADYYGKASPKAAHNADTCRAMISLPEPEDVGPLIKAACDHFDGAAKWKNLFAASEEERAQRFNLLIVMLTVVFDTGLTFGELCKEPDVIQAWDAHAKWCPDGSQPQQRWAKHARQARDILEGQAIATHPVKWLCELQIILDDFKRVRNTMHEPYKVIRAETSGALLDDVLRTRRPEDVDRSADEPAHDMYSAVSHGQADTAAQLLGASFGQSKEALLSGTATISMQALLGENESPIGFASERGHTDIVGLLLREGADPNHGCPLHFAADKRYLDIIELLLTVGKADVDKVHNSNTALFKAVSNAFLDVVLILIKHGASVNTLNASGFTPLHWAGQAGYTDVAEVLLEHGADVNANMGKFTGTGTQLTPLSLAAISGNEAAAKLFLKHGADVDAMSTEGSTPMSIAAASGQIGVMQVLLGAGAKLNGGLGGHEGVTPLQCASQNGRVEAMKTLLGLGADVNKPMRGGCTALIMAAHSGHAEAVHLLLDHGADPAKSCEKREKSSEYPWGEELCGTALDCAMRLDADKEFPVDLLERLQA